MVTHFSHIQSYMWQRFAHYGSRGRHCIANLYLDVGRDYYASSADSRSFQS